MNSRKGAKAQRNESIDSCEPDAKLSRSKKIMRRLFIRLIAVSCVVALLTAGNLVAPTSGVARAQVRPTYSEGAVGLGLLLRRLQTTASVLHTGAHPDDEDSA